MNQPQTEPVTAAGVPLSQIHEQLNQQYEPEAYKQLKYGAMKGRFTIDAGAVRDRLSEVFGIPGFGWRLVAHPVTGQVNRHIEKRSEGNPPREIDYHVACLENFTFAYRLLYPDGTTEWQEAASLSASADNPDANYAYRGAFSSLIKSAAAALGGMDHLDDLETLPSRRSQQNRPAPQQPQQPPRPPAQRPAPTQQPAEDASDGEDLSDDLGDADSRKYFFSILAEHQLKPADALSKLGVQSLKGQSMKAAFDALGIPV